MRVFLEKKMDENELEEVGVMNLTFLPKRENCWSMVRKGRAIGQGTSS